MARARSPLGGGLEQALVAHGREARLLPAGGEQLVHAAPASRLVLGAALHDVYHAGQIQLLKRLRSR